LLVEQQFAGPPHIFSHVFDRHHPPPPFLHFWQPQGFFQDGLGSTTCKACGIDTFGASAKATSIGQCEKCLQDVKTTGNQTGASVASACKCQADGNGGATDYFLDHGAKDQCTLCPTGAVCPWLNANVSSLYAQYGHWQSDRNTTKYWRCISGVGSNAANAKTEQRCCHPNGTNITGTVTTCVQAAFQNLTGHVSWEPDMQCEQGYTGPLCLACARGTHVQRLNYCEPCSGGSSVGNVAGTMVGVFMVFMLCFFWLLRRVRKKSGVYDNSSKYQKISGLASILIQWLQIVASLPQTLQGKDCACVKRLPHSLIFVFPATTTNHTLNSALARKLFTVRPPVGSLQLRLSVGHIPWGLQFSIAGGRQILPSYDASSPVIVGPVHVPCLEFPRARWQQTLQTTTH
jgi:hypothetical protein